MAFQNKALNELRPPVAGARDIAYPMLPCMPSRRTLALALSSVACASATVLPSVCPALLVRAAGARARDPGSARTAAAVGGPRRPPHGGWPVQVGRGGAGRGGSGGIHAPGRDACARPARRARGPRGVRGCNGVVWGVSLGVVADWVAPRVAGQAERSVAAFAAPPALSLRTPVAAAQSSFVNALTYAPPPPAVRAAHTRAPAEWPCIRAAHRIV